MPESDRYETTRFRVKGFISYFKNYSNMEEEDNIDNKFRCLKENINKYFNSHTHKNNVNDIENVEKATKIQG